MAEREVMACDKCYQMTNHKKWRDAYMCCECKHIKIKTKSKKGD